MKKYIDFVLIILLSLILVGCRNKNNNKKIEVTIGMWPDEVNTEDVEMFKEWKRRFETDYPQYKIVGKTYEYQPNTFTAMAGTGQVPTVFQTWFTEPQKLIKQRYVKDITDIVKKLGWYDKMDPDMRNALSKDGKLYGIPRDGYGLGLFMNLTVLEEAGILSDIDNDGDIDIYDQNGKPLYPTTFEELENMAYQVSSTLEDVNGFMILSASKQGGWQYTNIAWNFGGSFEKIEDGKVYATIDDKGNVDALKWIQKLKHNYEVDILPREVSLAYNDCWNKISSGAVAMCIVGSDALATAYTNMELPLDYPFAFVPMPAGPSGKRYSLFGGTPFMFSARATDEQVEGALRFLEYMGRSPELTEVSKTALEEGVQVASRKGMPILPDIRAWVDPSYVAYKEELEKTYSNINMEYFKDFFDMFDEMKHVEEPYESQDLYTLLDTTIQQILMDTGASTNVENLLLSASKQFQKDSLNKLN